LDLAREKAKKKQKGEGKWTRKEAGEGLAVERGAMVPSIHNILYRYNYQMSIYIVEILVRNLVQGAASKKEKVKNRALYEPNAKGFYKRGCQEEKLLLSSERRRIFLASSP